MCVCVSASGKGAWAPVGVGPGRLCPDGWIVVGILLHTGVTHCARLCATMATAEGLPGEGVCALTRGSVWKRARACVCRCVSMLGLAQLPPQETRGCALPEVWTR